MKLREDQQPPPMTFALILGIFSAAGALGIDLYLPAFPVLSASLKTSPSLVQLSLTAYFVAMTLGQLFYGPLSDRFGRRGPLLVGFALFLLASVVAALSRTIELLIVARFIQGIGACASMVVGRSIVRDLGTGVTATRLFSAMVLVIGISPIVAPSIGAALLAVSSWQILFWFMAAYGIACVVLVRFFLAETHAPAARSTSLSGAFFAYLKLAKNPAFLAIVLAGGFAQAGFVAYLAGSPYVFMSLHHVTPGAYAALFGLNAIAFVGGAQIAPLLLGRRSGLSVVRYSLAAYTALASILLATSWVGKDGLALTVALLFLIIGLLGLLMPVLTTETMNRHGHVAGASSGLMGAIQIGMSAGSSAALSAMGDGTSRPLMLTILVCAVLALVCAALSRSGDPEGAVAAGAAS